MGVEACAESADFGLKLPGSDVAESASVTLSFAWRTDHTGDSRGEVSASRRP